MADREEAARPTASAAAPVDAPVADRPAVAAPVAAPPPAVALPHDLDYRLLFEKMTEGFALHEMVYDEAGAPVDYRYIAVNPAFGRMTGLTEEKVVGRTVREVLPGVEHRWVEFFGRVVETGEPAFTEDFVESLKKYYAVTAFRPSPGRFCCFVMDITERKQVERDRIDLERQLLQAQKLESLGVLAGGIAHDFNNLLMSILGNAELALMDLSPMSPVRANLRDIELATRRAADLARQMLAYSGKGKFVVEPIHLNELVDEMAHLLEVSISKRAVLRFHLAQALPPFEGDPTQIRQIVLNLITNASDAVGDRSGVVALTTGAVHCDRAYLDGVDPAAVLGAVEPLPEGLYVYFEVADTGTGMDRETLARIFDPFFTTKFTGRGLGLAAVLGIVRGHRGAIKVYSEPGRGSTFKVLFPALPNGAEEAEGAPDAASAPQAWRGAGTVLLCDDEETVRAIGRRMLERMGFEVLVACDGQEALDLFRAQGERIRCVLLDLTMPRLDGEQAFREIRRANPEAKVILCSGYNEQEATQRFTGRRLAGFLQKPYRYQALEDKLRELLES